MQGQVTGRGVEQGQHKLTVSQELEETQAKLEAARHLSDRLATIADQLLGPQLQDAADEPESQDYNSGYLSKWKDTNNELGSVLNSIKEQIERLEESL